MNNVVLEERHFSVRWTEDLVFPFFEDENANGVYGYGHTDKETFARLVNVYDQDAAGETFDGGYTAEDVEYVWAQATREEHEYDSEFRIGEFKSKAFDGATPVTWVRR